MDINYRDFTIMWENEECTHVILDETNLPIIVERFIKTIPKQPLFSDKLNRNHIQTFIESRCFERVRPDKDVLLEALGLNIYNPWEIVKKTHGFMYHDKCWIRFSGETLTWEELYEAYRN